MLLLVLLALDVGGQNNTARSLDDRAKAASAGAVLPDLADRTKPLMITRFESSPVIDGKLDEEIWKSAAKMKDFLQTQPGDNIAPTHPTEVLLGYDSKNLYIAFRAYDDPGKVRATVAKRDQIFDDDTVKIILDTFNDKRRAYVLAFNALGVQADGIRTEGEAGNFGPEDYSLDIVMESKGALVEDGYVVEAAIPFKSLRYVAGKDKLWGVHVFRQVKRLDNEMNSWMPISRDKSGLLNQEGHLTGLEGIATSRTLELIPTLTVSETGRRIPTLPTAAIDENPSLQDPGRFVNKPARFDPGITVKFGITPNVTLDFAANPDFAQVEADAPVLTANQRFPIFFPEKRPFFLEGADIFQTPTQVVHTRTIIDPDYAAKLSGKLGRNSFGVLLASDNAPGSFSDEELNDPAILSDIARFIGKNALVGVLRLKRDVGKENNLGIIATSYNFIENHNQVLGGDGRFRIDAQTIFSFQALGTTTRQFFYDPDTDRSEYRTGKAFGYYWNLDRTGRNFGYNFQGQGRTSDYRTNVGFVRRTNTNYESAFFRFSSDPKPKATVISRRLVFGGETNFDFQGRLQSLASFTNFGVELSKQTFANVGYNEFYERIFEEEFGPKRSDDLAGAFFGADSERSVRGRAVSGFIETSPSKRYSASLFMGHRWRIFDFDFGAGPRFPRVSPPALVDPDAPLDPGAADTFDIGASVLYKPVASFSVGLDYNRNRMTRNDSGRTVFIANIYSLRSTYQFTRFTFIRARLDYDSLSARTQGQYLFGWTPNPGTSFYVGYNDDLNINGYNPFTSQYEPGFRRNGRTFFIKTSYLIRRSL
jgi:hypothetical protein